MNYNLKIEAAAGKEVEVERSSESKSCSLRKECTKVQSLLGRLSNQASLARRLRESAGGQVGQPNG